MEVGAAMGSPIADEPSDFEKVRAALKALVEPTLGVSIVDLNLISAVHSDHARLRVRIDLLSGDRAVIDRFWERARQALRYVTCNRKLELTIGRVDISTRGLRGVSRVLLVGSGKGGVGKSSIAVNLASALAAAGYRVGLMDADLYGPSLPTMLGTQKKPQVLPDDYLLPVEAHGMRTMSIGYLLEEGKALDWRGSLVSGTLLQFLRRTFWGELDLLVVDMPPGTGDVQLTIAHQVENAGVLLVTTPQEVALGDIRRARELFRGNGIPVIGLVENMAMLVCPHCGVASVPFARSSRPLQQEERDPLRLLASLPLSAALSQSGDLGVPLAFTCTDDPEISEMREAFAALAGRVAEQIRLPAPRSAARVASTPGSDPLVSGAIA